MTSVDALSANDSEVIESDTGKTLRVHKYFVLPANEHSHQLALEEIERYVVARNKLLDIKRKWTERIIKNEQILPEFKEKAFALRHMPRTGRKPTKERDDRAELRAADNRDAYAEFVRYGGSYATWWLAERASKKAKHKERDPHAGRAGILPKWLTWKGSDFEYCGTNWTIDRKRWRRRPIPEGARIVEAWLQRERTWSDLHREPRYRWFVVFVLEGVTPRRFPLPDKRCAAGLDIAWRQDDDTLRVAYVADSDGRHFPIRMRGKHLEDLQHAERLQALADQDANKLRAHFKVPSHTSHRRLLELSGYYAASKTVLRAIKRMFVEGKGTNWADEDLMPLERAEHLLHLMQWNFGQRRNALAARNEHYLITAHEVLRQYDTIYIEDIKGTPALVQKKSTRKKKAVDPKQDTKGGVARDQRQLAAPFHFLRMLEREAPKFNTRIVKVGKSWTSRICVACNADIGKVSTVSKMCTDCGQKWDIDHLAALNLLRWGVAKDAEPDAEAG